MKYLLFLSAIVIGGIYGAHVIQPQTVYVEVKHVEARTYESSPTPEPTPTTQEVVNEIVRVFADEPKAQLKRILDISYCESGWRFDAKNHNTNGSIDSGPLQINSVHIKRYGSSFQNDWKESIRVGYEIYKSSGFFPWVCNSKV